MAWPSENQIKLIIYNQAFFVPFSGGWKCQKPPGHEFFNNFLEFLANFFVGKSLEFFGKIFEFLKIAIGNICQKKSDNLMENSQFEFSQSVVACNGIFSPLLNKYLEFCHKTRVFARKIV